MGLRCSKAAAHELKVRTVLHPAPLGSEAESYMIYHKSQFIYIYILLYYLYMGSDLITQQCLVTCKENIWMYILSLSVPALVQER